MLSTVLVSASFVNVKMLPSFYVAALSTGLCLKNGTGVSKDVTEAARLHKLAADQGYVNAQFSLGKLCEFCCTL